MNLVASSNSFFPSMPHILDREIFQMENIVSSFPV